MLGDFEKFKGMIVDARKNIGPLTTEEKEALILDSFLGIFLSREDARKIVKQIEGGLND